MKINDSRENDKIYFETMQVGDVFVWSNEFWMKTRLCTVEKTFCNAVNIIDGTFLRFEDPDLVEAVEAELTIS